MDLLGAEDVAVKRVPVGELERQLAVLGQRSGAHAELLEQLARGALARRLSRLDAPARTVDLARAEAALLLDQEHPLALDDEHERRDVVGDPRGPVDGGDASRNGGLVHARLAYSRRSPPATAIVSLAVSSTAARARLA